LTDDRLGSADSVKLKPRSKQGNYCDGEETSSGGREKRSGAGSKVHGNEGEGSGSGKKGRSGTRTLRARESEDRSQEEVMCQELPGLDHLSPGNLPEDLSARTAASQPNKVACRFSPLRHWRLKAEEPAAIVGLQAEDP
jgi:hypothetical protein